MQDALSYKDVVLYPQYSEIKSRDDVNTSIDFLGYSFKSPVVPANMACCINFKNAEMLGKSGYFYILHRFYNYDSQILPWIAKNNKKFPISISIGVQCHDYNFLEILSGQCDLIIDFITIDVAHGDHYSVKKTCEYFHSLNWVHKPKLIVGNFGSSEGVSRAIEWGADAVKVGLSMGAACTTYNTTGVGTPMYSIVNEVFLECDVPIIADGQIREIGDIAKAIHAGANIVMVGSMFAACEDSPAEFNFYKTHKIFYGSASSKNKGHDKYVEGKESLLETNKMTTIQFLQKISQGLRSTMSYAGASKIYDIARMQAKRRYV
jgi:GMP reductase